MGATCRTCGAAIVWASTERGRKMPLDAQPVDVGELDSHAGLFCLRVGPLAIAATPDQVPGEPLYRSHFATCPDAVHHRRPREPGAASTAADDDRDHEARR